MNIKDCFIDFEIFCPRTNRPLSTTNLYSYDVYVVGINVPPADRRDFIFILNKIIKSQMQPGYREEDIISIQSLEYNEKYEEHNEKFGIKIRFAFDFIGCGTDVKEEIRNYMNIKVGRLVRLVQDINIENF